MTVSVTPQAVQESVIHRCWQWGKAHPVLTLVVATLLCLGPFVSKPVHLDDPLFLWAARQIQAHPLDPFGFQVNWSLAVEPMFLATQNPPLAAYYLALVAAVFGWNEAVLHTAFLLPALAAVLGTHQLAKRLCAHPVFAALTVLATPVFLVSSTTLMCDTMMLAFWVWAVVLWDRGLAEDRPGFLAWAAVLAGLAEVTKYFGVCLVPLLALYALLRRRQVGGWAIALLIPVAVLMAYQWATLRLYGRALFFSAGQYALTLGDESKMPVMAGLVGGLEFTGGCLAWPLFATPLLWRRSLWIMAASLAGLAAVFFHFAMGYDLVRPFEVVSAPWMGFQVALWTVGGFTLLGLAVSDVRRQGTPAAWLLFCWVAGTLIFAGFLNWTLNGRSLLPLAPAAAILLARRLEALARSRHRDPLRWMQWTLVPTLLLGLMVARADHVWAKANRTAAELILTRYAQLPGTLWFAGHWGFQHYMQQGRARPCDAHRTLIQTGDLLVIPFNNPGADVPQATFGQMLNRLLVPGASWVATMSHEVGAGFYSSVWGPLPFAFGRIPPEEFIILQFPKPAPPVREP